MLRESSRHDGLPNNQAARERQRERQRQERAQMLPSDDTEVSSNVQDLFNAPVKVKPSNEDPTSIEIIKTFGSYESARPYLMDTHGALQRRLIGVDLNTAGGSANATSTSQLNSGGDSLHRSSQSGANLSAVIPKSSAPAGVLPLSHRPQTITTAKSDSLVGSLFKHIPPASNQPPQNPKGLPLNSQSNILPLSSPHVGSVQNQVPSLNQIQNSINIWNVPSPLSPFPQRKPTKLSTTTLPITFVNTSSLNTFTTTSSEIGDLPRQLTKTNSSLNSLLGSSTRTFPSSGSSSAVKVDIATPSASIGASTPEKLLQQLYNFKKPLERSDSRVDVDSIIREMTDVSSPLSAILPKDSPPKKITPRRPSKNDERTIEAFEGINELKSSLSPLSTTGMNSSSSSSGSDSSDSDSDSDSSSGSEKTPTTTPVKNAPNTTRSPTERESWSLSSFVGGIRKENALIGAASTCLETKSANMTNLETPVSTPESSNSVPKPELNVSTSSSSSFGAAKISTNAISTIVETSKALIKPSTGFIKPAIPPTKPASKEATLVSHSKGTSKGTTDASESKRKVPPVPSKPVSSLLPMKVVSSALLKHKDPSLSDGSSDEEWKLPVPDDTSVKGKGKIKEAPKAKASSKRPATTTADEPERKKPRRKSNTAAPLPPLPVPPPPLGKTSAPSEKSGQKTDDRQGKNNKSLDRNKNDMIGRLFRPKKDKAEEGGKGKEGKGKEGKESSTEVNSKDGKSSKSRVKSPSSSNRVSAKDSGRKRNSTTNTGTTTTGPNHGTTLPVPSKTNGEVKAHSEKSTHSQKPDSKTNMRGSKSKRSTSPPKVVPKGSTNSNNTTTSSTTSSEKSLEKSKRCLSPKSKKSIGRSTSPKVKRGSGSPKGKHMSNPTSISKPHVEPYKSKSLSKVKAEVSNSSTSKGKPTSSASKSSNSSSNSKSTSKSMPPPPAPPPYHTSSTQPLHTQKKKEKKKEKGPTQGPTAAPSFLVRIPINLLPRVPKFIKKAEHAATTSTNSHSSSKKSESKGSREEKKEESRVKGVPIPSLVGSSVEDVTDTHNVPSKEKRTAGGSDSAKTASKERVNSPSSRKRTKSRSHTSSKSSKHKDVIEIDITADSGKGVSCELSSTPTPYTTGSNAAKTPPEPPDSSLNPTHSSSPTLTLPQPHYLSYYEKVEHHDDYYAHDQGYYLSEAKRLKHKADKEETGVPQSLMYTDSTLYFILSGVVMERSAGIAKKESFTLYKETHTLIRQISYRPRGCQEDPQELKLLILHLRIQSLLCLQLYKLKARETSDATNYIIDILGKGNTYEHIPPPVIHNSPQTTLSTPSPHSPALSPASATGSVSSVTLPIIHSPHHQSQQTCIISKHLYQQLYRQCTCSTNLVTAHELWEAADAQVDRHQIQDFFIAIDRKFGPLTLHSSLLDLVRYVREGLQILRQNLMDNS